MRILAILFLISGVALGGGAAYYAYKNFPQQTAAPVVPQGPTLVRVVATKVPLKNGDVLTYERAKEVLTFVEWPEAGVPDNAFLSAAELFGEEKDQVRSVLRTIDPGELILKSKVTGFGADPLNHNLSDGMRAVAIPTNAATTGGGLILPGMSVDIIFSRTDNGAVSTHTLLQNVTVIATDQLTDRERGRARVARTITVEVSPVNAQKLQAAMIVGKLSLSLRGVNETATDDEPASFDASLLPGAPKAPEPEVVIEVKPEPEPEDTGYKVIIRKGAEVGEIQFE